MIKVESRSNYPLYTQPCLAWHSFLSQTVWFLLSHSLVMGLRSARSLCVVLYHWLQGSDNNVYKMRILIAHGDDRSQKSNGRFLSMWPCHRRPPSCCCCAFRFCLQKLRQPRRIQSFALRSSFLMVLVRWSVCSSWWSAEWSVDYLCFWFMFLTLLNVPSNSAIDRSTVSIFRRPPFMGITTKESWTCTISPMRNVCGSHETNLPPPKLCELSSLIVDSVYWLSVPISVSLHVKVSDLVVLGVHVRNGSVAVCHVL